MIDIRTLTPKALHSTAQGRAAHPGFTAIPILDTPKGFHWGDAAARFPLWNPCGVQGVLRGTNPGCAARPWAVLWNRFAVKNIVAVLAILSLTTFIAAAHGDVKTPVVNRRVEVIDRVQPNIVKIYGAGGLRGLEAYQSGFLISPTGHLLTVWSYVLDSDTITVTLNDGRKFEAEIVGARPQLDLALLKLKTDLDDLPHFVLADSKTATAGSRVLAFSNLYRVATGNEAASVQRGVISVTTPLEARRGVYETPYHGPVYVLDAITNNPGAAGGALTNRRGELIGMLGKELRSRRSDLWLNYAMPIAELRSAIDDVLAGRESSASDAMARRKPVMSLELDLLGIVMVPDLFDRTPPFIDGVRVGSPAHAAGLRRDDLVLLIGERLIQSCKSLVGELQYVDRADQVKITVMRNQKLIEVTLKATGDMSG